VSSPPQTGCSGTASKSLNGREREVRLVVRPCRVAPGETAKLVLINDGEATLGHSFGFSLEKRTTAGWRWINKRQAFPLPLFYLRPGKKSEPEPIAVYFDKPTPLQLSPGLYRVTKDLDLAPGTPRPPTMTVRSRLQVIDSP
jgi:hypothetical protein